MACWLVDGLSMAFFTKGKRWNKPERTNSGSGHYKGAETALLSWKLAGRTRQCQAPVPSSSLCRVMRHKNKQVHKTIWFLDNRGYDEGTPPPGDTKDSPNLPPKATHRSARIALAPPSTTCKKTYRSMTPTCSCRRKKTAPTLSPLLACPTLSPNIFLRELA